MFDYKNTRKVIVNLKDQKANVELWLQLSMINHDKISIEDNATFLVHPINVK